MNFCKISENTIFIEHLHWLLVHVWVFQIKVNICCALFSTLICFAGGLKICIAKKNLFTQTEKLEQILPVLPKKRNQM